MSVRMMMPGVGGGSFSPDDIASLEHWFDPSDLATVTVDGSNNLTAITDKSGNGNPATVTAIEHGTSKGTINGIPAMATHGGACQLSAPISNMATDVTLFAVLSAHTDTGQLFDVRNTGDENPLHDDAATGGRAGRRRNDAGTILSTAAASFTFNTPHLLSYRSDGSTIEVWRDGVSVGSAVVSGSLTGLNIVYWLKVANGAYGDLLAYSSALSTSDRQAVENYLSTKWGTP